MNAWRRSAGLDPVAEGFAAKVAVIRTQWRKLEDAGAFDIGSMARLETFIRHEHGVSAPHFLEPRQADQVIASLGEWLRRKQAEIPAERSEEHTSELQSLMRISYAVFCFK